MKEPMRVEREALERVLQKMIRTKPTPKTEMPKSKKKLVGIVEPITH
jgi:hypothetical protein